MANKRYGPGQFLEGERARIYAQRSGKSGIYVSEGIVLDRRATKIIPGTRGERGLALRLLVSKGTSQLLEDFEDGIKPKMHSIGGRSGPFIAYYFYHCMKKVEHFGR